MCIEPKHAQNGSSLYSILFCAAMEGTKLRSSHFASVNFSAPIEINFFLLKQQSFIFLFMWFMHGGKFILVKF